jgi:hypothetical protein
MQDGAQPLIDQRYRYQEPPSLSLDSDDEDYFPRPMLEDRSWTPYQRDDDQMSIASATPSMRRRKSFFSLFHRKSELEKLLDLYLDEDEQPEPVQSKPSLVRRMTRSRRRKAAEVHIPDVPPLPSTIPPAALLPG